MESVRLERCHRSSAKDLLIDSPNLWAQQVLLSLQQVAVFTAVLRPEMLRAGLRPIESESP